ncbi:hypothetical protein [Sinorhizobium meliloti]|uniref:hypothetical protein n=2 Tax=Rhizobium meliloti TaxID=382 RepID=UPI000FDA5E17|nr:hypothetical protein [Sinorhizobium meliloti]RVQ55716.1 hypothetical protein CN060_20930 [Sinorhizobium meliloti]
MTKDSVTDWDTDPSNNTDIAGINITGAGFVSGFDGAMRTMMAQLSGYTRPLQQVVFSRAGLKALDTTKYVLAYLGESGREGTFKFASGDFSARITADTQEGVYIKATAIASSAGAWVRVFNDELDPFWFGAVGDGTTDDSAAITGALALNVKIDGFGRTYKVTSVPSSFLLIKNAAFNVGSVTYISRDFLRTDTAKITNNFLYTGWAEVKSYPLGDSLRVWAMEKESHADGTGRILCFTSDDGGSTYSPGEYLDLAASGRTLWSAGYSGTTEYLIVRVPAGSTDVPPYTYERWHRTVTADTSGDLNTTAWTVTAITFPTPVGFTGQPVMVIDFTTGHGGSIVVGTSYGEGAAAARSTDSGATWTSYILGASSSFEEPTIRYDAATQRYYGFIRNGTDGQNPRYWHSGVDDLTTISLYTAPSGTFGTNGMSDSPIPFEIRDGRIHAFGSYRNGTLEGAASDELTSAFYLDFPVIAGNAWSSSTKKIYRIGTLPHRETGGASAVGVGAVMIHDDKVHLIYGMEERTGAIPSLNRIVNLYQTIIFLADRNGMHDFRNDVVTNRASVRGLGRQPKGGGFTYYAGDAFGGLPALFGGRLNLRSDPAQNVISGGVLTISGRASSGYLIDTEAAAATDDLDTITNAEAQNGDIITLTTWTSSRDVTVKNGTGNIFTGADRVLSSTRDFIVLKARLVSGVIQYEQFNFSDNA